MRGTHRIAAIALGLLVVGTASQAQGPARPFAPRDESVESLPAGPGREETFGMCTACHNYKLVSSQGMTRQQWDETMTWMTQRHNMPDVQGAERDRILDYLAQSHPPRAPSRTGGFRNPFAPQ